MPLPVDLVVRDVDDLGARAGALRARAVASSSIVIPLGRADVEDLAATSPATPSGRASARIVSCTWQKQRVCVPSPWISSGAPGERRRTKRGTTMPYCPLWRGPTVLKSRTITQSRSALLVVREREELVDRLRLRVEPPPRRRRAVHAPALLVERLRLAPVAVDLRGRGDEHALAEAVAVVEDDLGALDVRDERAHGLLDDEPHADRRARDGRRRRNVHELVHDRRLEHRVDDEMEVAPCRAGARRSARSRSRGRRARRPPSRASRSSSARWEPMKPAPPVMRALCPGASVVTGRS